jgi:multidrug efflux pump subunit AcrA (membrane-fusion protein)
VPRSIAHENIIMRWFIQVLIAAMVSASVFVALATLTPARSSPAAAVDARDEFEGTAGDSSLRVFAEGTVEGAQREIALRFEVSGRIKVVHVLEGASVKAGDVLAEMESDLAELQLTEAQTQLKIATAERDRILAASGGRNQTPLSPEEKTITDGNAALAEAAVRRELLLVEKTRLRAPIDGIVLRVAAEPGELTGPTDERDLFTLVDRAHTRVRADVEELDGLRVMPGQLAVVSAAASPDKTFRGTVLTCSPCFRPKAQYRLKPGERLDIRVREVVIELDDGNDLLIGLPVEVFIEPQR